MSTALTEVQLEADSRTLTTPPIVPTGPAKVAYRAPFLEIEETPVRFPNGAEGSYARINPGIHGGVAIPRSVTRGIARYGADLPGRAHLRDQPGSFHDAESICPFHRSRCHRLTGAAVLSASERRMVG